MSDTVSEQGGFARALNSKPFAFLWIGQTISSMGDGAFLTALAWQVLLFTGSGTAMGLVMVARSLPMVIFLPLGGVVADRLPRYLVMLWSDGGRAFVVLLLAGLGWFHLLQFWHLLVLALLFGIADGFFMPAYQAIPPQLVEKAALQSANALTGMSQQMSLLLGPLIGAGCVALLGPASAFAFDGLTFIISALCLTTLSSLDIWSALAERSTQGLLAEIREGTGYVLHSTWLWVSILVASVGNMGAAGSMIVALPKLVHDVYHADVWLLGALTTLFAIGIMIGAILVGQRHTLRRRGVIAYVGLIICSGGLVMFGIPLPHAAELVVAGLAGLILGFGFGVFQVIWTTLMQELVPSEKLGRVTSLDLLVSTGLLPIGYAVVGVLTDHIGPAWIFVVSGLLYLVLSCLALCVRDIRRLA